MTQITSGEVERCYHIPCIPYGPIDALNRRAAALGSPRYAMAASDADYNGHRISLNWNSYRQYYVAEYFWAGRHVLARGDFESCLKAVVREYQRGALGTEISISVLESDQGAIGLCEAEPLVKAGELPRVSDWYTWRHEYAAGSVRDYANPRMQVYRFDWALMQRCQFANDYTEALREKYGSIFH